MYASPCNSAVRLNYKNDTHNNASSCRTRNTMRKRRLPPIPPKREMETSWRHVKKPKKASWMNNFVNTLTNGGNKGQRKNKPRGRKSELNRKRNWHNKRRKRKSDYAKRKPTKKQRRLKRRGNAWKRQKRRDKP